MFSYQHSYHAGNLADIHKHALLSCLLHIMIQKDKPLTYIDMHAGRAIYDLNAPEAEKTQEANHGIKRALYEDWFLKDHPYKHALQWLHMMYGDHIYPGSPALAAHILRPTDKIHLIEGHPEEFQHLSVTMRQANISLHYQDSYKQINALAPPLIKRGVVFIDPSYEQKEEYKRIPEIIKHIHKKWNVATILLWYPILPDHFHLPMIDTLSTADLPKTWKNEVLFDKLKPAHHRMIGSGLFCINSPYGLQSHLDHITTLFNEARP